MLFLGGVDRPHQALDEYNYLEQKCLPEQEILELQTQQWVLAQVLRVLMQNLGVLLVHVQGLAHKSI